MVKQVTIVLAIIVAAGVRLSAATINVPSQQPTIQAGINVAGNGDTVLVSPGNYFENVTLNWADITLRSVGGASATTITSASSSVAVVDIPQGQSNSSTIRGFTIQGASNGSGLRVGSGNAPQVLDCVFEANSGGGGAYFYGSSVTVRGCLFENNSSERGGGIWVSNGTPVLIDSCVFRTNSSGNGGSALAVTGGANVTISRNLVYKNTGTDDLGGAIYLEGSNSKIINNTVCDNYSSGIGAGIMIVGSAEIRNNIVAFNRGAKGVAMTSPSPAPEYNDVFANLVGDYWGTVPGTGWLNTDPQFVDTATGDYTLQSGSLCINAGDPNSQYNDLDGSRNDMGAFPDIHTILPYVSAFRIVGDSQFNVVSGQPRFEWNTFSPTSTIQALFEIAVGTDADWTYAEMWNPVPIISMDSQVSYSGSPLVDGALYYLRLRIEDSVGWSPWHNTTFRMNSVPGLPALLSPNSTIIGSHPVLTLQNASDAEGDALKYDFEVYADSALSSLVASQANVAQTSGQTSWTVSTTLPDNLRYWWRARAFDSYEHGNWSSPLTFWVDGVPEAPNAATLISPPDSAGLPVLDLLPTFRWSVPSDPDPFDMATYKMQLSFNPSFALSFSYDSLHQNQYTITDSLPFGTHLWWRVTSRDKYGLTSVSPAKNFWTWELGDVDHSHGTDIADLSMLIDFLYISFTPITPLMVADMDGDCAVDIADLTKLIDRLYISFTPLGVGCE